MSGFLVDANLPVALARQLAFASVDCVHVIDIADVRTRDTTLWDLAEAQNRTIITRDADFADLARAQPSGPAVVWVRLGNVRKQVLLDRIQKDWPKIVSLLTSGERLIELR
jgi:predicted nuclease of predicted toxin-antitoxin system